MTGQPKKRLGELLMEARVIDEPQLASALAYQRQWGVRLGQALVELKFATEADIVEVLARRFGFDVARLDRLDGYAHQQALQLVGRDFALKNNVFPMQADTSTLTVAMSDPTNLSVVDELRFRTGRRVKVTIGGDREIAAAVKDAFADGDPAAESIALDLDTDEGMGSEAVMDPFGGGSEDAMHAFYGAAPTAPVPIPPEFLAPFPAPLAQPGPLRGAPVPPVAPALRAPPAQPAFAPGALPARPQPAPAAAAAPVAPRPAQAAPPAGASAPVAPRAAPAPQRQAPPAARPPQAAPAAFAPPVAPRAAPPPGGPRLAPQAAPVAPRPAAAPQPAAPPPPAAAAPRPAPAPPTATAAPAPRAFAAAPEPLPMIPFPPAPAPGAFERGGFAPELELEHLTPLEEDAPAPAAPGVPPPAAAPGAERAVLDALARLVGSAPGGVAQGPALALVGIARLLLRKGLVSEAELLAALRGE